MFDCFALNYLERKNFLEKTQFMNNDEFFKQDFLILKEEQLFEVIKKRDLCYKDEDYVLFWGVIFGSFKILDLVCKFKNKKEKDDIVSKNVFRTIINSKSFSSCFVNIDWDSLCIESSTMILHKVCFYENVIIALAKNNKLSLELVDRFSELKTINWNYENTRNEIVLNVLCLADNVDVKLIEGVLGAGAFLSFELLELIFKKAEQKIKDIDSVDYTYPLSVEFMDMLIEHNIGFFKTSFEKYKQGVFDSKIGDEIRDIIDIRVRINLELILFENLGVDLLNYESSDFDEQSLLVSLCTLEEVDILLVSRVIEFGIIPNQDLLNLVFLKSNERVDSLIELGKYKYPLSIKLLELLVGCGSILSSDSFKRYIRGVLFSENGRDIIKIIYRNIEKYLNKKYLFNLLITEMKNGCINQLFIDNLIVLGLNIHYSPVMVHAIKNHCNLGILEYLVSLGCSVNKSERGIGSATPLMLECSKASPNEEVIKFLLKNGADKTIEYRYNSNGKTALILCCARQSQKGVIKLLINAGSDITHRDSLGKTALQYYVNRGGDDIEILEMLKRV